jgi:hypothetical protein
MSMKVSAFVEQYKGDKEPEFIKIVVAILKHNDVETVDELV